MRELFLKIFGDQQANEITKISLFSWHHILYVLVTFAIIAILAIIFFKKEEKSRINVLNIIAILIAISYIGDFFLQPFRNGGTLDNNANIIIDKFPFHICVILCPLILYSRFGKFGKPIKTPCAVAACVAPLMWLIYPGTALDTDKSAFSYELFQLFTYHSLVFIYGILYLILREDKLNIKKCYKEAILVLGIALWATLGNLLYSAGGSQYNWLFLKDPVFSFIPKAINAYVVVIILYLSCLVIYGVYYLILFLHNKLKKTY